MKYNFALFPFLLIALLGCEKESLPSYKTKNVVVIVIDGIRYSESWGLQSKENIPYRVSLAHQGVICGNFYNNGPTLTVPGHTAILTGIYQSIDNSGAEYPQRPSIFQLEYKNHFKEKYSYAQIIASKDKLEVLSDCTDPSFNGLFRPQADCGLNGLGSGYREDSITFIRTLSILQTKLPKMLLVCFKDPDTYAHAGDSLGYIQAIKKSDEYVDAIWKAIQSNPHYKNQTSLFVTNDHGRHNYNYSHHGDGCDGCRHIEFLALGPDFRKNYISNTNYDLLDIAPTIAELLGFTLKNTQGEIMWDLF